MAAVEASLSKVTVSARMPPVAAAVTLLSANPVTVSVPPPAEPSSWMPAAPLDEAEVLETDSNRSPVEPVVVSASRALPAAARVVVPEIVAVSVPVPLTLSSTPASVTSLTDRFSSVIVRLVASVSTSTPSVPAVVASPVIVTSVTVASLSERWMPATPGQRPGRWVTLRRP